MSMNFSEELIYSKTASAHGNYKYLKIVPVGSTQNPTLSLTSTTQTQFELPNNVINLAKSKLSFDLQLPISTNFSNLYANALGLIDRKTLTSRSGTILADIPNTFIFGSLVSNVNTKLTDLMSRTANSGLALAPTLAPAQLNPINDIVRCNSTANYQINSATPSVVAYSAYTEPAVMFNGTLTGDDDFISYQINLSAFKDTLMEINKNIYFGDNLVLTINWNAGNKFVFNSATIGNVVTANAFPASTNCISSPLFTNLCLYVATETDPTIIAQLVGTVSSGEFSLMIPFVYCQKYVSAVSSSTAMQQRINRTYGSTLLRTYFGVYHLSEDKLTTYTHNDSYVVDYNTYMDGLRLQDFTIKVSDSSHWLVNEQNFKDSCVQSLQHFKTNFVHIDNWCGASPCNNDDTALNGLSLDSDRTWSFIGNTHATSASYRNFLFFTTQKKLVISKGVLNVV